jgi:hypothetical protein
MYLLLTREGNGYHCSCCRRDWTDLNEFDSKEALFKQVASIRARQTIDPKGHDDGDVCISGIYNALDIETEINADATLIKIIAEKVDQLKAKIEENAQRVKEESRKVKIWQFEKLKKELEEPKDMNSTTAGDNIL